MSKYTTEVRFLCENAIGLQQQQGYNAIDWIVKEAAPFIFDFDFPIFDEDYRLPLEIKILKHYYTREIGEETYGLWKLRLNTKLNEIMPYYNKLYTSGLQEFNPLWDTQITTDHKRLRTDDKRQTEGTTENTKNTDTMTHETQTSGSVSGNQHQTDTGNGNNTVTAVHSDTPQGDLNGMLFHDYLTSADKTDTTTTDFRQMDSSGTSEQESITNDNGETTREGKRDIDRGLDEHINSTEDYVVTVHGRQGGDIGAQLLTLKNTLLNIDMMIIEELQDLFMNIW